MSDQENFLTRWSRRKLEPAEKKAADEPQGADAPPAESGAEKAAPPGETSEFDISTLPSLDSIGADSDIRAFLQAGVPSALRHAALRRAWSADPAIRDFVGLNENFWEGAGPEGVPGFGALDPNLDIKKLVSEIFGDSDPKSEPAPAQSAHADSDSVPETPQQLAALEPEPSFQRDPDVASQHEDAQREPAAPPPRRHGGAMPQ